MLALRTFIETPAGLLVRVTVNCEEGKPATARVDAGVPAFEADPQTLRALAGAIEHAAAVAQEHNATAVRTAARRLAA